MNVQSVTRLLGRHGTLMRSVGAAMVLCLAMGAFAGGATTSGIPQLASESWLAWLYYSGGLFVFGGLDLGAPDGGPELAQAALWMAYFLAPVVTTSVLIDVMLQVLRPKWFALRGLRDHVILAGTGQVSRTYLRAVRTVSPGRTVALIGSSEGDGDDLSETEGVVVVKGDVRDPATLQMVGLDRAALLVFATGDDLEGLEAAWAAQTVRPDLHVAVHVADLGLLRPVNRVVQARVERDGRDKVHPMVFNAHRIAALHLYEQYLYPHFESTGYKDVVVIGGFGRLAQTIFELLRVMAADELQRVVIVDPEATRKTRQLGVDVAIDTIDHVAVDGDLEDPATWDQVNRVLEGVDATPVFVLASDNDVVNYRSVMLLRQHSKEPRIFARCFRRTEFAESLAEQLSFELLVLEDLLSSGLEDHCLALLP